MTSRIISSAFKVRLDFAVKSDSRGKMILVATTVAKVGTDRHSKCVTEIMLLGIRTGLIIGLVYFLVPVRSEIGS